MAQLPNTGSQAGKGLDIPNNRLAPSAYPSGNAPDGPTRAQLGPLLGQPYRGQGSDNGVTSGGIVAPAPAVVIAPPASRVAVPMPVGSWGTSNASTEANSMQYGSGYESPQEHIAQVPVPGFRRPAAGVANVDIALAGGQPGPAINFYIPSPRQV